MAFPPVAGAVQETTSCPRKSSVVCPGPTVLDVAVTEVGACGTVVALTGSEGSDGSEVPFAFIAVTVNV